VNFLPMLLIALLVTLAVAVLVGLWALNVRCFPVLPLVAAGLLVAVLACFGTVGLADTRPVLLFGCGVLALGHLVGGMLVQES
jgi:hypothetical protein